MRIRDGSIKDTDHVVRDLEQWNARRIKKSCVTCYRRDVEAINDAYISSFQNLHLVEAICCGNHSSQFNHPLGGQSLSIPKRAYYSVGMMVRLKINICPEEGLFTNARGIIVGLEYPPGGYNLVSMPVVIVDFVV